MTTATDAFGFNSPVSLPDVSGGLGFSFIDVTLAAAPTFPNLAEARAVFPMILEAGEEKVAPLVQPFRSENRETPDGVGH